MKFLINTNLKDTQIDHLFQHNFDDIISISYSKLQRNISKHSSIAYLWKLIKAKNAEKLSTQVIRTKILFSLKIRSAKVIMTKKRSFQIILDPIENRSAERFVQLEVVQFEALL